MAVAYASIATASAASGNLTITKPTGLAAGDLMVAGLHAHDTASAWSASGWTVLDTQDATSMVMTLLFKVASSGDAAASDFTFTNPGNECAGALVRVTGVAFTDINNFTTSKGQAGSGSTPAYTGVTTRIDGDLLVQFWASQDTLVTFSTYAVATNNPTWTERADFQLDSTEDISLAVATATFTTAGATGDFSVAISSSVGHFGFIVAVSETISPTVSPAVVNMPMAVQDPAITGTANVAPDVVTMPVTVQAPTVTVAASKFTNPDKNAATFVNTTKSTTTYTNPDKSTTTWSNTDKTP